MESNLMSDPCAPPARPRRKLRCNPLDLLALLSRKHHRMPDEGGNKVAVAELSSKGYGKRRASSATSVELRLRRKIEHPEGSAPRFEPLGVDVDPKTRRISHVKAGSLAERSGVRVFDLVLKVDGKAFRGNLAQTILYSREPLLRLERPAPHCHEALSHTMGDAEWVGAIVAALSGDEAGVLAAARLVAGGSLKQLAERRFTSEDCAAVGARVLASTGEPMQPRLRPGTLLVECALEMGHRHVVQLLLSDAGGARAYAPPPPPSHAGGAAEGSGAGCSYHAAAHPSSRGGGGGGGWLEAADSDVTPDSVITSIDGYEPPPPPQQQPRSGKGKAYA